MGALDKRIFSGVAIVSALLFVVSAVMLLANGGEVSDDANDIALYIVTVAGILAVVYAAVLVMDRSSFVRTVSGALTAVAGVMFLIACGRMTLVIDILLFIPRLLQASICPFGTAVMPERTTSATYAPEFTPNATDAINMPWSDVANTT